MTSFKVSCGAGLLVIHYIRFCKAKLVPLLYNDNLFWVQCSSSFPSLSSPSSSNDLKIFHHCVLNFWFSVMKDTIFIFILLYLTFFFFFFLAAFKVFLSIHCFSAICLWCNLMSFSSCFFLRICLAS